MGLGEMRLGEMLPNHQQTCSDMTRKVDRANRRKIVIFESEKHDSKSRC